jgi:multimeric flavodoxin WrbA
MKVIAINGSSRLNGNTHLLIDIIFNILNQQGIYTEEILLSEENIDYCKGCFGCKNKGKCVFDKDDFNKCYQKLLSADGIILGSPVYSADVSGRMKVFLEKAGVVAASNPHQLMHKVGLSIAAVRRGGGLNAVDTMNHFLLNKEVILVGSTYWNMVYGRDIGDVLNDIEGIENIKNLAQNMVWLLNKIREN